MCVKVVTINLAATCVAGASYSWTGPGGFNATAQELKQLLMPTEVMMEIIL